ncbi:MAG TPA: glutamate 5-kinase [Clostridiales bacterium]|jgi:glutamate 5-kinase|nr:glutamate 5-kinase [Tissierellia bacterium]HBC31293.1 glutamate 5-kinase [Clostridiales bacterium]HCS10600.1 glutamate 5-kinase [Clostridiales bacterium]
MTVEKMKNAKRIVFKVGTSTLTYSTGKLNIRNMDKLAKILSDLNNQGKEVILVTSGAITAGVSKLRLKERPKSVIEKQACASVGQCDIMYIYDKFFSEYNSIVSQMLLTKNVMEEEELKTNMINTLETLISYKVIPIINENDTIAVDEIIYGDNDTLSAMTAKMANADVLIILTDMDGLYDDNPQTNPNAKLIPVVNEITPDIEKLGGKAGSKFGTGGMATKISAAKIAVESGIDMVIINGSKPELIYDVLDNKQVGTLFAAKEKM